MSEQERDPQLEQLRFLERVQQRDLARTRGWIRAREQRLAELADRDRRRPPPDWVAEASIGQGQRPVAVHQGGCLPLSARVTAIPADEARRLLDANTGLACQVCRPDTALGLL